MGTDHVKTRGKEPECGSKGPENKALGFREDLREVWGMVREGEMGLVMDDGRALWPCYWFIRDPKRGGSLHGAN